MFTRWLAVLLIVLQLQPVLAFMPESQATIAEQVRHAVIHDGGTDHHHDDHLGVQIDDGQAAHHGHVHHDASHHVVLLTAPDAWPVPAPLRDSLGSGGDARLPDPDLEGLLRPPRDTV
jgi:hypothetical protein